MFDFAIALLILSVVGVLVVYRHWLAKIWFRMEDPRTIGLFRIGLGTLLLGHLIYLAPLHEYLYTSEGLLTGEEARSIYGEHRVSLLYQFDSLGFVTVYAWVLWIACAAFTLGLATRVTKWLTWFLLLGMIARNGITLAGDHVFASYLFYLCLSRCEESFSVDAWIRRKRDPALPAHRPIPGWPRNLMLLQMIPMLCANGLAQSGKWGQLWRDGDMVYHVLNHPDFQPGPRWEVSAMLGTNLFRAMTWTIQAFEILFPLVIVGFVGRFLARQELRPLSRSALWFGRVLFLLLGLDIVYLATSRWDVLELPSVLTVAAGVAIALAPLTLRLVRRMPERARASLLGRRIWATLLFAVGVQLFFVLEINLWTGVVLCSAVLLFEGEELARAWAHLGRRPTRPTGSATKREASPFEPLRRRAIAVLSGFHVLAISAIVLPHAKPVAPWREAIEHPLKTWVFMTVGWQSWRMFTWSGGWRVHDLEVTLRDGKGDEYTVGDGILALDDPRALDRRQKARHSLRYQQYARTQHARWVCRNFTVPTGDEQLTVIFYDVKRRMPTPEELTWIGPERAVERMEASRRWTRLSEHPCD